MIRLIDTLIGRTILVSLIAIGLMHVLSLWSYEEGLRREMAIADDARLADKLVTIRQGLQHVPQADRDKAAHQLSAGPIEVHWSPTERAVAGGAGAEQWQGVVARLKQQLADVDSDGIVVGSTGAGHTDPHVTLVSVRLPDETWVNVSLFAYRRTPTPGQGYLMSTSLMALGIVALSIVIARWLTRPIRHVAAAVRTLHPGDGTAKIDETGPREVRDLAIAFNDMQERIANLIDSRTRALAAVSHDLRTPLTRLRLRIEDLGNAEATAGLAADISELEQMIDATLSYLSGDDRSEVQRPLDLSALLRTLADDAADLGQDVTLSAPQSLVVQGRHLGLKRAFSNLIQNAVKYGTRARVQLTCASSRAVVIIEDDGPGIPDDKIAAVMEPFVRLESSRNRETGGVGLGLTIARAAILADAGTLTISNRPEGGLRVGVEIPLANR